MPSLERNYPQYLTTKRSVDDRAINNGVLRRLESELRGEQSLRVLNLGAGLGGVIERLVERGVFPNGAAVECVSVDIRPENLEAAGDRLRSWARSAGWSVSGPDSTSGLSDPGFDDPDEFTVVDRLTIGADGGDLDLDLSLVAGDAFAIGARGEWDLLVGQAFLDLFDVAAVLPALLEPLSSGGYCYFPITFDGGTVFEPPVDAIDGARLERAFHDHLDRDGDSHAGRHLLTELPENDCSVLAAGSSDWVVHAESETYPATEAEFLAFIVDTISEALIESDVSNLETDALETWRTQRHEQIERGELVYITHQLDVLGRVRPEGFVEANPRS